MFLSQSVDLSNSMSLLSQGHWVQRASLYAQEDSLLHSLGIHALLALC